MTRRGAATASDVHRHALCGVPPSQLHRAQDNREVAYATNRGVVANVLRNLGRCRLTSERAEHDPATFASSHDATNLCSAAGSPVLFRTIILPEYQLMRIPSPHKVRENQENLRTCLGRHLFVVCHLITRRD